MRSVRAGLTIIARNGGHKGHGNGAISAAPWRLNDSGSFPQNENRETRRLKTKVG
jgi:hypothetical protein